jgi:hypothetical protein
LFLQIILDINLFFPFLLAEEHQVSQDATMAASSEATAVVGSRWSLLLGLMLLAR